MKRLTWDTNSSVPFPSGDIQYALASLSAKIAIAGAAWSISHSRREEKKPLPSFPSGFSSAPCVTAQPSLSQTTHHHLQRDLLASSRAKMYSVILIEYIIHNTYSIYNTYL